MVQDRAVLPVARQRLASFEPIVCVAREAIDQQLPEFGRSARRLLI
jgi:hypothetical protein